MGFPNPFTFSPPGRQRRPFDYRRGIPSHRQPEPFGGIETFDYGFVGRGAYYGAWITGRGGPSAGDTIESFPYAIEFLLREFRGATDDDINTASFDASYSALSGWTIKGFIVDAKNIDEHISNMANQCKSVVYQDEDGKYAISTYDSSASVSYTEIDFEKDSHFGDLEVFKTDPSDLVNTVRVKYNKNAHSGEYTKETFIECKKIYSGATGAEAMDSSETTYTVSDGSLFNTTDRSVILVDHEVMIVTGVSSNDLTVTRGAKNSTAATHDDSSKIWILQTNSDDGDGTQDQNTTDPDDREDEAIAVVYKYNQSREMVVFCDMIGQESGGDDTAIALRNHLFDFNSVPHYGVTFHSYLMVSDLIITDVIEFDSAVMDSYLLLGGQSWSGKKFEVVDISRFGEMDYRISALEL